MNDSSELALRQRAAAGSLLLAATIWGAATLRVGTWAHEAASLWAAWNLVGAALLAVAAGGTLLRSLLPQVLSRGVALWVVALALPPSSESGWLAVRLVTAALAALSLFLGAPVLETKGARAEFAPLAFRRTFLAAATASVSLGVSTAFAALWEAAQVLTGHGTGVSGDVWGAAILAVPFFASAIGVLRMRAWGVLLGAATALGSIACALPVLHEVSLLGLVYVCIPGALLASPIIVTRLRKDRRRQGPREATQSLLPGVPEGEEAPGPRRASDSDEMSVRERLALPAFEALEEETSAAPDGTGMKATMRPGA